MSRDASKHVQQKTSFLLVLIFSLLTFVALSQANENKGVSGNAGVGSEMSIVGSGEASGEEQSEKGSNKRPPGPAPKFEVAPQEGEDLVQDVHSPTLAKAFSRFFIRLQPNQGGIIWLFITVTILIALDFKNLLSWRNFDLLLLLSVSFFFIDLIDLGGGWNPNIKDSAQRSLFGLDPGFRHATARNGGVVTLAAMPPKSRPAVTRITADEAEITDAGNRISVPQRSEHPPIWV